MQSTLPLCPIHFSGGSGHDNNFPLAIWIPLMKCVLNILDKSDSEGRKGPVEIYVCGVLIEMGVRKTVIK